MAIDLLPEHMCYVPNQIIVSPLRRVLFWAVCMLHKPEKLNVLLSLD